MYKIIRQYNYKTVYLSTILMMAVMQSWSVSAEESRTQTASRSIEKPAHKSGYESDPGFSGPAATGAQLEEDDIVKKPVFRFPAFDRAFKPWFDKKRQLKEEHGLAIGFDYRSLYQSASDVPAGVDDSASSGIFRMLGKWELLNRGTKNVGALVFSVENRHAYGDDIAPADLGFSIGYLGIPGTLFSDVDTILGDFNWQQLLNDGQTGLIIGRYDPNDFFDVLGYQNPSTSFQNAAILLDTSIALPDWSTGIGVGHWLNEQWYIKGAINDANGVAAKTNFFDDSGELYTTAELGWSPSRAQRYFNNIHVTAWHVDEREKAGVGESDGIAVGANWTFDEKLMLFLKAGWSDGPAPLYNESVTAGMIYYVAARSDLVGLGINWGDPADDSLREQVTSELFYRLQLAENLAITPSIQLLDNPSLNPAEDKIWLTGVRLRVSF